MPLTDGQMQGYFEKIVSERDKLVLQVLKGEIPVDVASSYLANIDKLSPLTPVLKYTNDELVGVIEQGAYHVSFKILGENCQILNQVVEQSLDVVEFPYVGVPWGEVNYNGLFLILIGRR